ncbi:MAG: hypothetical protein CM15mP74_20850 [Halieaceae bacterium]|nr:MAG: hypothetical protein CM15mP74_20850 [Halieaceae bacterium]
MVILEGSGCSVNACRSAKLLKIWSPLAGVAVTNRAGSRERHRLGDMGCEGLGNRNLTLSVCAAERNWSLVINRLGRPRLSKHGGVSQRRQCLNSR